MWAKRPRIFCLPDQEGREVCLSRFLSKWVVLYFYPRDNTLGCTREAKDFSERLGEFERLGAVVLGVSKDSVENHRRFRERRGLRVTLLSDPEHRVIEAYGAWGRKKSHGREYYGTVRSTFIIDPEGVVRRVWRNVKVRGHVDEVLEALKVLVGE